MIKLQHVGKMCQTLSYMRFLDLRYERERDRETEEYCRKMEQKHSNTHSLMHADATGQTNKKKKGELCAFGRQINKVLSSNKPHWIKDKVK